MPARWPCSTRPRKKLSLRAKRSNPARLHRWTGLLRRFAPRNDGAVFILFESPFMTASFVIAPPPQAAIAVQGDDRKFPVRRIWCVGRNYLEHIRELGNDERNPPFFFAKHADMVVPDGSTIPYPTLTKDMQHEVELVVEQIVIVVVRHGRSARTGAK